MIPIKCYRSVISCCHTHFHRLF